MSIKRETEELIKERADIVAVIGDYYQLRKRGVMYECLCPFHNDRHLGSFKINPQKNTYKCYSCDAGGDSIDFLMKTQGMSYPAALRYLASKFGVWIDENDRDRDRWKHIAPAKPRALVTQPSDLPRRTWPASWVAAYQHTENDVLCQWLRSLPWNRVQRERLEQAFADYRVGHITIEDRSHHRHDFTAWWEIDEAGTVHNCHLMKYQADGHRDKESDYTQTWLHARMRYADPQKFQPFDDQKEQASYCLFGEHLLSKYPAAVVRIVESEKTAVIMAIAYGNDSGNVWMACCGMQNLNPERLAALTKAQRHIMLYPDRDGIDRWLVKMRDLKYARCSMDTTYVTQWWKDQDGPKADCADVVLRSIMEAAEYRTANAPSGPTPVNDIIQRHPILGPLVEDLQLYDPHEQQPEHTTQADQAED